MSTLSFRLTFASALIAVVVAACSGATGSAEVPATPSGPLPPESAPTASPAEAPTAPPAPAVGAGTFGAPVGQVECDYGGHDDSYHIHATLRIYIGGVETDPDDDVGVDQTRCMYWVHTHDATGGVIHVEAPENVTVTLGDFMNVWAVSYPDSTVLQATLAQLDAGGLSVDGAAPVGTWRDVVLADGTRLEVR